jgi:uncharacterized protein YbaP (TraB family)
LTKEIDMRMNVSMLKWSALLLLVLVAPSAVLAQPAQDQSGLAEKQFPPSTSVWKVTTDSSVVYLLGSIHLLKPGDLPLHPKMEEAFKDAETLVFEVDIDSAETPAFQQYVLFKSIYDGGKTLQTELGDSVYSLLKAGMSPLGLDVEQMKQFKPWVVAITFLALKLQQLGFDPDFGVDRYFYEKAKAEGKSIVAFETPEYQIDLFDSMPKSEQRALVLETLEDAANLEEMLDEIILGWRTGDLDALEATINKSLAEHPEIRERLLTARNRNWLPRIESCINGRGTCLVIVGVGHMAGEDGLVNLLRKAGYNVEQM